MYVYTEGIHLCTSTYIYIYKKHERVKYTCRASRRGPAMRVNLLFTGYQRIRGSSGEQIIRITLCTVKSMSIMYSITLRGEDTRCMMLRSWSCIYSLNSRKETGLQYLHFPTTHQILKNRQSSMDNHQWILKNTQSSYYNVTYIKNGTRKGVVVVQEDKRGTRGTRWGRRGRIGHCTRIAR